MKNVIEFEDQSFYDVPTENMEEIKTCKKFANNNTVQPLEEFLKEKGISCQK